VGLVVTLVFESLGRLKVYSFPAGVSASGLALVLSLLTFFVVSWLTRRDAPAQLDPDLALIMEL
jgi:hypothetical protein